MNQPELARPARAHRSRQVPRAPESVTAARVTVAWTAATHDGAPGLAPTEIELVAGLDADQRRTWTCPRGPRSNWLEALRLAHCREIVLTARLGGDVLAKHLVLELAEFLTLELTLTQPLIRVLFLSASGAL